MSKIVEGYAYDIFVSYRHKDNKHDGWITNFVQQLKMELAVTIKADVSIYFDNNIQDGLRENHIVDKSIQDKIRCLILVPVVSRTYCDPKSFAWQQEFIVFNRLTSKDRFGRDIKVRGGNTSSRIVPIIINRLDDEDRALIERELKSPLRGIEFIYSELGVDRPLFPDDSEVKNVNGTKYINQLNKVAQAVKELIDALQDQNGNPKKTDQRKLVVAPWMKYAIASAIVIAVIFTGYLATRKTTSIQPMLEEKSIAIMAFLDLSENKDQGWFSDGLTEEILNSIARVPEMRVIARTSSFSFKDTNLPITKIADSLGVNYIVEGSVRKVGQQLRITAQLIKASNGFHMWSQEYNYQTQDVFSIQEDIATNITKALDIYIDEKKREEMFSAGTRNVEAYEAYLKGNELSEIEHRKPTANLKEANQYYQKATELDPTFAGAFFGHADLNTVYLLTSVPAYSDSMPRPTALKSILHDLDMAIKNSKRESEKIVFQMQRMMMSSDWHDVPSLVSRLKNDTTLFKQYAYQETGWSATLLMGVDELVLGSRLVELSMRDNPLSGSNPWVLAQFMIARNMPDSAYSLFKLHRSIYVPELLHFFESYFVSKQGKYDLANSLLKGKAQVDDPFFLAARIRAKDSVGVAGIVRKLKVDDTIHAQFMALFHLMGDQRRADSIAHEVDGRTLGAQTLLEDILLYGGKMPFNLSATPQLLSRLKEAGVDVGSYQSKRKF